MLAPRTYPARVANPKADPRFVKVGEQLKQGATKLRKHAPPAQKAHEASRSAKAPANERLAGAKAQVVEELQQAPAPKPQPNSFKAMLRAEIAKLMPKTLGDTEKFMEGGQAGAMQGALAGGVGTQKDAAASPTEQASQKAPDVGAVPGQPSSTLPAEPQPQAPPVAGAAAMPLPVTTAEVSLQDSKRDTSQALAEEKIKPESLHKANDPRFTAVAGTQAAVGVHADKAPAGFRVKEAGILGAARGQATGIAARGGLLLAGTRGRGNAKVLSRQQQQAAKEEAQRQQVAVQIESIYARSKARVELRLTGLDAEVAAMFEPGVEAALAMMKSYVDQRLFRYKLDRYLSIPIVGAARWIRDQFMGLPEEVNTFYQQGRALFQAAMDGLIDRIATVVEQRLVQAKAEVAVGQAEIRSYVASLPVNLKAVGQAAEKSVGERFAELKQGIEDRKNELAAGLAQKYKEAFDKADAALKAIQDENRGLVARFVGALVEVIKALLEFKARLLALIKKGMETIQLILDDPIGFLGNLIRAVKGGFLAFVSNIWTHLKAGFMKWLFGSLVAMGIRPPADLSLLSVFKLVLDVLGITYEKMRAKAVKLVGERAVGAIEKVVEYVQEFLAGGAAKLWEKVKEDLANLKDMVISAIQDWLIDTVVKQAVTKIVSMFNPAGAIIQAIIAIYNVVMFVIEKAQQLMALVEAVINSLHAIATGAIGSAVAWIEKSLAAAIPVVIGFLARLLGLSGITQKIQDFIKKVQGRVDAAIDKVIAKVVAVVKKMFGAVKAGAKKLLEWWKKKRTITNDEGKKITLYTEGNEHAAKVLVASSPGVAWTVYLAKNKPGKSAKQAQKDAHSKATGLATLLEKSKPRGIDETVHATNVEKAFNELAEQIEILNKDAARPASVISYGGTASKGAAVSAEATILSSDHPPGNPPGDNADIWAELGNLGEGLGKTVRQHSYVQGHLLNHNLGGPGMRFNLTPITKRANNKHKAEVETTLKAEVNKKSRSLVVYYKVTALKGPPKGGNPRLAELTLRKGKQEAQGKTLNAKETREMLSLKALNMLTAGFKCEAYELEKDESGEWTKKGKILPKFTTTVDNDIQDGAKTYGY